jgi:hypothetical protein
MKRRTVINIPSLILIASLSSSSWLTLLQGFPLVSQKKAGRTTIALDRLRSTKTEINESSSRSSTSSSSTNTATTTTTAAATIIEDGPTTTTLLTQLDIANLRFRELQRQLQGRGETNVSGRTTAELRKRLIEHVFPDYVCIVNNNGDEVCGPEDDMNVCVNTERAEETSTA